MRQSYTQEEKREKLMSPQVLTSPLKCSFAMYILNQPSRL